MFCLLFRDSKDFREEKLIAADYFPVYTSTHEVPFGSKVILRYSAQPFFSEVVKDLSFRNSKPANSFDQVYYVNNMDWVADLGDKTPKTWFESEFASIPDVRTVAKGKIRSIRERWEKDMLCGPSKTDRAQLYSKLLDNDALREQGIVFREYLPLKSFGLSLSGMPIANEWRFIFWGEYLIDYGYYWVSYEDKKKEDCPPEALAFALECSKIVGSKAGFYSLDVAEKEIGGWTCIELNEGQQSGLCGIDADSFYASLKNLLVDAFLLGNEKKRLERKRS